MFARVDSALHYHIILSDFFTLSPAIPVVNINGLLLVKACYERGKEVTVVPKMCSSSDSSWFGFAKYAWSG